MFTKLKHKFNLLLKQCLPVKHMNFDIFMPFELPIMISKSLGMWMTKHSCWEYKLYCVIMHLIFLDIIVMSETLMLFENKTTAELTLLMSLLPTSIGVQIETILVCVKLDEIYSLMDMVRGCIEEYGMSDKFKHRLIKIDKIYKMFLIGIVFMTTCFGISAFLSRDLICPFWLPYDTDAAFNFNITVIYQIFTVILTAIYGANCDLLSVLFMMYIIGMLEQLCERLENIKYEPLFKPNGSLNMKYGNNRLELLKCIKYQLKIHEIAKKLNSIFSIVFLVRGFGTMIIICTSVLSIVIVSDTFIVSKLSAFISLVFSLVFIPSCYGNKVTELSDQIRISLFHSEWLYETKEYRQMMRIVMECSKNSIKITAVGLFSVNLESFKKMCETTYSLYHIFESFVNK